MSPEPLSFTNLLKLRVKYHQRPDLQTQRFGQLVVNHFNLSQNPDLFYEEDRDEAFAKAVDLIAEL